MRQPVGVVNHPQPEAHLSMRILPQHRVGRSAGEILNDPLSPSHAVDCNPHRPAITSVGDLSLC